MVAELIWRAEGARTGHVATYKSHGATVKILIDENAPPAQAGPPGWVRVGLELAEKRIREYLNETGHLPSRQLIETFQRVMGERLDAFIEDPRKHPFQTMGLKAFEDEMGKEGLDDT